MFSLLLLVGGLFAADLPPNRSVEIDTREGTWMSLDVSPDGKQIVFDMLGDIYMMPSTGGDAKRLTVLPKTTAGKADPTPAVADAPPKPKEEEISKGQAYDCQPRFSPDGKQIAFISDRDGSDNIWVMNVDGTGIRQVSKEKPMLNSPAWSPDGKFIAVRRSPIEFGRTGYSGELWVYRVEGGPGQKLTTTPKIKDVEGPVFSPSGDAVYFTAPVSAQAGPGGSNLWQVNRLDRKSGDVTVITDNYGGAARPWFSPDGAWMAYGTNYDSLTAIRLRDMKTGAERIVAKDIERNVQDMYLTELDLLPGYAFSPDARWLYISHHGRFVRISLPDGRSEQIPFHVKTSLEIAPKNYISHLYRDADFPVKMLRWAQYTPDGSKVIFEALGKMWTADVSGAATRPRRFSASKGREYAPSLSPDGAWIAYVTWSDVNRGDIFKVPAAGGAPVRLTRETGYYANPVWSPDGKKLAFVVGNGSELRGEESGHETERRLCWMDANGGEFHTITRKRFGDTSGKFNRDGTRFWFDVASELHSIQLDGTDEITHFKLDRASQITPSPDESSVAFSRENQIWVMPMPWATSATLDIKVSPPTLPMKKVSGVGGYFPAWMSNGTLVWTFAGKVYKSGLKDAEKPVELTVDLTAPVPHPIGVIALRGARIVTLEGDQVIPQGTIVINGNRIVDVGPQALVQIPAGARIIDLKGKTIVPGFMDMHDHFLGFNGVRNAPEQYSKAAAVLSYGITTARDPSTANIYAFNLAELINSGEMIGPRSYTTGQAVTGQSFEINNLKDAEAAVDVMMSLGAPVLKHYMQPTRRQRQLFAEATRRRHIMSTSEGSLDYKHSMTLIFDGLIGTEHAPGHLPLYNDVAQLMAKAETYYTPTITISGGAEHFYRLWDVDKDEKLRRFILHSELERLARAPRRGANAKDVESPMEALEKSVRRIVTAGGKVAVGSHDSPTPSGLGTHWEIWSFVDGGLTPLEALRASSLIGAEALGMADDLGSLKKGKVADLVVLNSDPLANIRSTTDIFRVMRDGFLYDGTTLDEIWPTERKMPPLWPTVE